MVSLVKKEKDDLSDSSETKNRTLNNSPTIDPISSSGGGGGSTSSGSSFGGGSFLNNVDVELNKKRNLNEFGNGYLSAKKRKIYRFESGVVLNLEFLPFLPPNCILAPLPLNFVPPEPEETVMEAEPVSSFPPVAPDVNESKKSEEAKLVLRACKQFWKAGDYEGGKAGDSSSNSVGMDHLRVHPKFLHSNATSHKWALGAFAELLDNSLDEVCNGATYIQVDLLKNKKDGTHMLLVEDNGGGMTPDKMRQCMSLGYSAKSKMANTIDGNGFKTSTMRLGADVIVFSRCQAADGKSPTQSIGMLSYTFLRGTGKEDIVVPMIDYEKRGEHWNMLIRSSPEDWSRNLETIIQWSPYKSEEDLTQQFNFLKDQGTRIIIYNLWEDDEGNLELDFDSDPHDIQLRGENREEKNIGMAKKYPNSRHFLTYRHSLRSYASILYLRLPPGFRIILRGQDVEHHNVVKDMMLTRELRYKPASLPDRLAKDSNMAATVTIGFVKDAHHHIDIQGFNVYHKNRLIKPFWRVWNAAGSDGRGAIGVLEANFVEPAHDKQGFEHTSLLARLEARLVAIQKDYWSANCHEVGYAPRRHLKTPVSAKTDSKTSEKDKSSVGPNQNGGECSSSKMKHISEFDKRSPEESASKDRSCHRPSPASGESHRGPRSHSKSLHNTRNYHSKAAVVTGNGPVLSTSHTQSLITCENGPVLSSSDIQSLTKCGNGSVLSTSDTKSLPVLSTSHTKSLAVLSTSHTKSLPVLSTSHTKSLMKRGNGPTSHTESLMKSKEKNHESVERVNKEEGTAKQELSEDLPYQRARCRLLERQVGTERDRCRSLESQLKEMQNKLQESEQRVEKTIEENITLINIFQEELKQKDEENERLRERLREASNNNSELLEKVKQLEG